MITENQAIGYLVGLVALIIFIVNIMSKIDKKRIDD